MVVLLHRDDVYEKESTRPGEADLIVAKHRNGSDHDITVAFQATTAVRRHGPLRGPAIADARRICDEPWLGRASRVQANHPDQPKAARVVVDRRAEVSRHEVFERRSDGVRGSARRSTRSRATWSGRSTLEERPPQTSASGERVDIGALNGSSAHQPDAGHQQPHEPGEVARYPDEQEGRAVRDREVSGPGDDQDASSGQSQETLPRRRQPARMRCHRGADEVVPSAGSASANAAACICQASSSSGLGPVKLAGGQDDPSQRTT